MVMNNDNINTRAKVEDYKSNVKIITNIGFMIEHDGELRLDNLREGGVFIKGYDFKQN